MAAARSTRKSQLEDIGGDRDRRMSSSTLCDTRRADLDPPPWPHPPWLTSRPQACAGSARQKRTSSTSPPVRDEADGKASREGRRDGEYLGNIREGEEIVEFYGQLWAIDSLPPRAPRVRLPDPSHNSTSNHTDQIFWVRRALVDSRKVTVEECYPVGRSDRFEKAPVKLSFARDFWGKGGKKKSFTEILKAPMAEGGRWIWQP